ncbi:hypothetical protein AXF42_Ash019624 [Apostasia shenzhenica]|uniref:Uncharacterized protein n=1 Tax=Apostasia shenzhenica TaxID=1088818 RepID=A0A2I0A3J2_9ASPA|nr:hypothetical protein AXF42_Ash019624 [Apostasia shenzhenica]
MKCKKHPCEVGAGICASCLRDRLLAVIAEQNKLAATAGAADGHLRRRSDDNRPPLPHPEFSFPRSVSPYVSHRRSVGSNASAPRRRLHRFFSTPQAGPVACADQSSDLAVRQRNRRFSLWSAFFGHLGSESTGSRSSESWISALIRRKKKSRTVSEVAKAAPIPAMDRGMSPEKYYCEEEGDGGSGYSSDSSDGWRMPASTPMRRAAARQNRLASVRGISGFAVCLSPLVRPSPNCRQRHSVPESGFSADSRPAGNHHVRRHVSFGEAAAYAHNRSRKIADFGRLK